MGIAESKVASAILTTACSKAEENGRKDIKHVLSDPRFVDCLANLWKHLPQRSKTQIEPGRKRTRQAAKTHKDNRITLSGPLQLNIDSWEQNPGSFFAINTGISTEVACPVAAIYRQLSETEIRSSGDRIRLRFLKVLFHHMKDRCCANYLRRNTIKWMTIRVVAAGLDGGNTETISSNIKDWAYLGGKYDALSRDIGDQNTSQDFKYLGNLFRLPEDVTDRFILKELPVTGDARKKVIDSFVKRGIRQMDQTTTLDSLAEHIFGVLWNKIESSIPHYERQESVSASLGGLGHMHGARIIRLQNGDCRSLQRSDEISLSRIDPMNAVYPSIEEPSQIDNMNAVYLSLEDVAYIDPINAVYPSIEDPSYIDDMNAAYPAIEEVAHIDPMNAMYPGMGGPPQIDNMNAAYPALEDVSQMVPVVSLHPQDREQSLNIAYNRGPLIYA